MENKEQVDLNIPLKDSEQRLISARQYKFGEYKIYLHQLKMNSSVMLESEEPLEELFNLIRNSRNDPENNKDLIEILKYLDSEAKMLYRKTYENTYVLKFIANVISPQEFGDGIVKCLEKTEIIPVGTSNLSI